MVWWSAALLSAALAAAQPQTVETELAVYGATAGGVAAAVQAARCGLQVVLVEPTQHVGGLTSGGLGATDVGRAGAIGGLAREFYDRVAAYYKETYGADSPQFRACHGGFRFEPHIAEQQLNGLLTEAKVKPQLGRRLESVERKGNRVVAVTFTDGLTVRAKLWIDTTYEGDLMAAAKVSYTFGREANAQYGETISGVQVMGGHQFRAKIDPYRVPGDPASGLLPGIMAEPVGERGAGDKCIQAYNYRMCLTKAADRLPFPKPEGYAPDRYLLMLRYLEAGVWDALQLSTPMPNGKTDTNNHGAVSTDYIGGNFAYPDADWPTREKIVADHRCYQQGLMYFLANDPRVPEKVRAAASAYGLPRDEFVDNGGWPHQLYIREARRMLSAYVMTEHHCRGKELAPDSVGLASYGMDSHNCRRLVIDGVVRNEGDVEVGVAGPYPVSYRSIVPKEEECANLFVPVCLSATHMAYGSIRMEPVFMVLGQSAATAAALVLPGGHAVQSLEYAKLRARLLADKQVLDWTAPAVPDAPKLDGVVVDESDAVKSPGWVVSTRSAERLVGKQYLHDGDAGKGQVWIRFEPEVPAAGRYELNVIAVPNLNRATKVPVTVEVPGEAARTVYINQREGRGVLSVGQYQLAAGKGLKVTVANTDTQGYVVIDGLQLKPLDAPPAGAKP